MEIFAHTEQLSFDFLPLSSFCSTYIGQTQSLFYKTITNQIFVLLQQPLSTPDPSNHHSQKPESSEVH